MATHERMLTRRHASASSLPLVSESNRLYTLDRQKTLEKKKSSCQREHLHTQWKVHNFILEFSTSAYEMAKTTLYQLLSKDNSPCKIRIVHGIDNDQANVEVCIRVFNKLKDGTQGKTMKFVITFYHTNSRMMINGTRVDLFVSDIYKDLCEILNNHFDELNILNKDLFDKINNTQQYYN